VVQFFIEARYHIVVVEIDTAAVTQLTQHAAHGSKTKYTLLYAKGHSAQPDMFWRTHYTKSDP